MTLSIRLFSKPFLTLGQGCTISFDAIQAYIVYSSVILDFNNLSAVFITT